MSGFREFSRSDKCRPSSLKEFENLPFSAMRKPSLKYFLKTELDLVTSQGNIFLTRLTTGVCSPLLTGGFRFYRIYRHEPGDSKQCPSPGVHISDKVFEVTDFLIPSFLLLPVVEVLWVDQTMVLLPPLQKGSQWHWDGYYLKISIERKRGNTTFVREISGSCKDLACKWESGSNKKNSIDPMSTIAYELS